MAHQGDGRLRVFGVRTLNLLGEVGGVGTQVGALKIEGAGIEAAGSQRGLEQAVGEGAHALPGEDEYHVVALVSGGSGDSGGAERNSGNASGRFLHGTFNEKH